MQTILLATDFSERSDRALRRAALLAGRFQARLILVHVVDNDQPADLMAQERDKAEELLLRLASACKKESQVDCDTRVVLENAFTGIAHAVEELKPDLLVMGAHRRQLLGSVFTGTTVERTIRSVRVPVLMVNASASSHYHHILETTDLSDYSAAALHRFRSLGMAQGARETILHVFDSPALRHVTASAITRQERDSHLANETRDARSRLVTFLSDNKLSGPSPKVCFEDSPAAHEILDEAADGDVDLIVVATRGRTGLAKLLLGSVTDHVLRSSPVDVLAIPLSSQG